MEVVLTILFTGVWAVMTNALFAYMGTELIGVTVGEAENPRKNIPKAIRRTFWRILVFYIGGVFVIGLIVPFNDTNLFTASKAKTGAAASPFVVAATNFGIKGLNHVINGAILSKYYRNYLCGKPLLTPRKQFSS